jgi:tRNA dimethylallyltransferase
MAELSNRSKTHANRRTSGDSGPDSAPVSGGEFGEGLPVILIGGATASGKSALALDIAEAFGGTVINADSMQVYRELRVVTARPADQEMSRLPHELYGVLSADEACSAGRWLALAHEAVAAAREAGRLPVLVGGTGLYLRAFEEGLAAVPTVPDAVVDDATARLEDIGAAAFYEELEAIDPVAAARVPATDSQRMIRVWAVAKHTGRALSMWQADGNQGGADGLTLFKLCCLPDREKLYPACDLRFESMVADGAIEEVERLMDLELDPALPAMRAVGVRDIAGYLAGDLSEQQMIARGQTATRQYAKRQFTWFRRQMTVDETLDEIYITQDSESLRQKIFTKIRYLC